MGDSKVGEASWEAPESQPPDGPPDTSAIRQLSVWPPRSYRLPSFAARLETVAWTAACDGEITESEREFLVSLATVLDYPIDLEKLKIRAQQYQVDTKQSMAGKAADSAKESVTTVGRRLKGFGGTLRRREGQEPPDTSV